MEWQYPEALYWVLPLCLAWLGLACYSQKRRQAARAKFVEASMGDRILPQLSQRRFYAKLVFQEIAILAGLLAMAQPQFGDQVEQVVPRGSDLYVLIDVSRSMLAKDVPPSRLERAKADVLSLVNRLDGERIGLIAFAGQAVVKCPLTVDYDSFRRSLTELDPNSAPRGGTAIGDAIRKSLEVFQANAPRDQAILLISDGDDQQSYPMEAAAAAAERNVTVFSVGLGDATTGSRIPQQTNKGQEVAGTFVEFEGQQVWSKLDGSLLQEIAMKTSGVYVPAGTKVYDLGELYSQHLQGRRGDDSASQTRVRKAERFQIFLCVSLFALLADLGISRYRIEPQSRFRFKLAGASCVLLACMLDGLSTANAAVDADGGSETVLPSKAAVSIDANRKIKEGLKYYTEQKYAEAQLAFSAASEKLQTEKSKQASIAIFDEACALHRKGDFDAAKERYLLAGLTQERSLSTAAHFNLAMMLSEQARVMTGDNPELVEPGKRKEILDKLKQSIGSYRHCLEIDPNHAPSRKNLELVRQWIKFYSDRWAELDRQKRRQETNLVQFLDFMIASQTAIQSMVQSTNEQSTADRIAELKRLQQELIEEVPILREKIETELQPQQSDQAVNEEEKAQREQAIQLLQSWADESLKQMTLASSFLQGTQAKEAIPKQDAALESLGQIWNAVVDFRSLLQKTLQTQSKIGESLEATEARLPSEQTQDLAVPLDFSQQERQQRKALTQAMLLAPKAAGELEQMESQPLKETASEPVAADPEPVAANPESQASKIDPEEIKKGLRVAVELAPKAVKQMEQASEQLKKNAMVEAKKFVVEAERILKEIADAQPKNPEQEKQDEQNQQDQNQQDQKNESQGDDQEQKEQSKEPDSKKDPEQKDPEKKDPEKKDQNKEEPKEQKGQEPKPGEISKDRLEEALRKVKEREQEKRDRDRELKARILGRAPVEKDW